MACTNGFRKPGAKRWRARPEGRCRPSPKASAKARRSKATVKRLAEERDTLKRATTRFANRSALNWTKPRDCSSGLQPRSWGGARNSYSHGSIVGSSSATSLQLSAGPLLKAPGMGRFTGRSLAFPGVSPSKLGPLGPFLVLAREEVYPIFLEQGENRLVSHVLRSLVSNLELKQPDIHIC